MNPRGSFPAFLLILLLMFPSPVAQQVPESPPHTFVAPVGLQDGDIVFRRGTSAISRIALAFGEHPRFSHVGMVVRNGDSLDVIHSIPLDDASGVRVDSLEDFCTRPEVEEVAFYGVPSLDPDQRTRIREYLFDSVGEPFDYRFSISDATALYCTELVVRALRAAGVDAGNLETVRTVTLTEPAIPPDSLRRSSLLQELPSGWSLMARSSAQASF